MNNPKTPFHAVSHYDAFGNPPFVEALPREEEDFATLEEAREWLAQRGGGTIQRCRQILKDEWEPVETVEPAATEKLRC